MKIALNLYLSRGARISEDGAIEARYHEAGSNASVFLSPEEEGEDMIVSTTRESVANEYVRVKTKDRELTVTKGTDVTHRASPECLLGYAVSSIPFLEHDDAGRSLMGANMMKQALRLKNPEPPIVQTGVEDLIGSKLEDRTFVVNGQLSLGTNLLVGYLPWDLLNYEDAVVISGRLVEKRHAHPRRDIRGGGK